MFKTILAPVDRSALTARELDTAVSLAERFDAQLIVLRVMPDAASLKAGEAEVDLDVIDRETRTLLAEALSQLGGRVSPEHVKAEVRSGPVVGTILEAAGEWQADLVVVGSHGRSGPIEWFTGSTAEQVVARCPSSVLVVKPEGFPFLKE